MSDKVTVLVPIYNVEKYVAKCLESLLSQTYQNFEVWAVIDGSPDNSKEIVEEYAKRDSRIKLIDKENGGYGSVLEYGVQNIKSKYFLVCDPDDWLRKDALEKLVTLAEKNNLDLVVGDKFNVYDENEEEQNYVTSKPEELKIIPRKVYSNINDIQKFAFFSVSPHAKLFRTEIAKNIKFPRKVSYTDFVLYIESLINTKRIAYLDEGLAYYLTERPGNTKTDVRPSIIDDYLIGWNTVFDKLDSINDGQDVNQLLFRLYWQLRFILSEYYRTSKNPFKDSYINKIDIAIKKLQSRKNYVIKGGYKTGMLSLKGKLTVRGMMNPITYKPIRKMISKK